MNGKMRRRYRKKTRTARRMLRGTKRVPRNLRMGEVLIKRTIARELWAFNGGAVDGFWRYYTATLAQMPSIGEIANLFDSIKISALKFTFVPRFTEYAVTQLGSPALSLGYAHVIVDQQSNVVPAGVYTRSLCNTFLENGSVRSYPFNRKFSVYYKPRIPEFADTQSSGEYKPSVFLNSSNGQSVPHRGFHIFLQDSNFAGATGPQWDVFVTYYLKCRSLK